MLDVNSMLNSVHCWDSLEIMKQIPDNAIDLIITDPPYWIGIKWKVWWDWWFKWKDWKRGKPVKVKDYWDFNNWDEFIPDKEYFDEIKRISKNAIIFWWNYFIEYLDNSPCWIVWDKNNSWNFADCELAWTNFDTAVRKFKYTWNGMLQENMKHKEKREHPTQKPVDLFKAILENYSKPWDVILDCFAWSWTTAVAAIQTGRKYIVIEKEKEYCDIIHKRIKSTTLPLFTI